MGKLTPKDPVIFNTSLELKEQLEIARFIRQSDLKFKESEFFKQLETIPDERKKKYINVVLDFNLVIISKKLFGRWTNLLMISMSDWIIHPIQ